MTSVYDDFWTALGNREYENELVKQNSLMEDINEASFTERYPELAKFAIVGVLQYFRKFNGYLPEKFSAKTFRVYIKLKEEEIDTFLSLPTSLLQLIAPAVTRIQHNNCSVRRAITYDISEHFLRYTLAAYLTTQNQFECSLVKKDEYKKDE